MNDDEVVGAAGGPAGQSGQPEESVATTAPVVTRPTRGLWVSPVADTVSTVSRDVVELAPGDASHERGRRRPPLKVRAVGRILGSRLVIVSLVVALVAAAAALALVNHRHAAASEARDSAPSVIAGRVEKLLSYTPRSVESDVATEKKWLSGTFATQYGALATSSVVPAAIRAGITADASVVASAVESATAMRVKVVLFVDIQSTTQAAPEVSTQNIRLRVTAVRVGDEWRISEFTPI